jgi:hypothetical protein
LPALGEGLAEGADSREKSSAKLPELAPPPARAPGGGLAWLGGRGVPAGCCRGRPPPPLRSGCASSPLLLALAAGLACCEASYSA